MSLKALTFLFASTQLASAITIQLDYRYDGGFFNAPERRTAMRAVCDYFESIIGDSLARIDPNDFPGATWNPTINRPDTGNQRSLGNIVIPADTIILFVGGRNLSSAGRGGRGGLNARGSTPWFNRISGRGQPGAIANPATDFAPWGGQIAFDSGRTWNFSLTDPNSQSRSNFVPIALHEVCHILGIGSAPSWDNKIVADEFTGSNARAAFGRNVPTQIGGGHWRDDRRCRFPLGHEPGNPLNILSPTIAQFGTPGGQDQQVLLDPSSCNTGPYFRVLTELDLAGLADIGWEIGSPSPPPPPEEIDLNLTLSLSGNRLETQFNTSPNRTYQLERSSNLTSWSPLGNAINGDGTRLSLFDPAPPSTTGSQFYRITVSQPSSPILASRPEPAATTLPPSQLLHFESPPRICTDCFLDH